MRTENRICGIPFLTTISSLLLICGFAVLDADEGRIDWEKARELLRRQRQGQSLTDEERAYLERAKQERAAGRARPQRD
ncbi:MAG: hypothetical protein PVJ86_01095, partial [Phycisphaerales bacterium]